MLEGDIRLLLIALGGVLLLVGLIVSRIRLHPLIALLVVSLIVGLLSGMDVKKIAQVTLQGAGGTLGDVGVIVALGAMLGKILATSGVTEAIAEAIVKRSSDASLPWAMALAAFVVGIPMFFEVGLVVVLPLVFSVARKLETGGRAEGSPYVLLGVPVIAALSAMHGMVPPHPGPLTAIATLKTTIGPTMLYGFVAAIPAIILGGPIYARFIAPRMTVRPDQALLDQFTGEHGGSDPALPKPGLGIGLTAVLMPAILMLTNTLGETVFPKGSTIADVTAFLGEPLVAMLASVLFASIALVYLRGGGAFKEVLVKANVGHAIINLTTHFALPPLPLGWMIAMLLSVATGSATVGIVGAAGLLAPLATSSPDLNVPLLALAIGSGSLFFNYANHAGFWLVKEAFGMTLSEATKTISVIQSIVAVIGLIMALLMNLLPALPS